LTAHVPSSGESCELNENAAQQPVAAEEGSDTGARSAILQIGFGAFARAFGAFARARWFRVSAQFAARRFTARQCVATERGRSATECRALIRSNLFNDPPSHFRENDYQASAHVVNGGYGSAPVLNSMWL
jgi:hypothetical protein